MATLAYVGLVTINDIADAVIAIGRIRPSIYIKGQDYQNPQGDRLIKCTKDSGRYHKKFDGAVVDEADTARNNRDRFRRRRMLVSERRAPLARARCNICHRRMNWAGDRP
jgi:hypothetical protein